MISTEPKPIVVYHEADASLEPLKGKQLAVVGYGSQGHAHALNLRDAGLNVIIGLLPGSKSIPVAEKAGFEVVTPDEAVRRGDIIMIAVSDMAQAALYRDSIEPNLGDGGKTLLFSHGLSIHWKQIVVPAHTAVIMVAPKGPGHLVRSQALLVPPQGTPALIAVHQDPNGDGRDIALAWAHGIGSTRAGVLETTFGEEGETDLFGEQTVLCGGVAALVTAAFEVLVEAGYSPVMAYFECLHELKLTVDLMNSMGLPGMWFSVSETAKWGGLTVGPSVLGEGLKDRMRAVLENIRNGSFVQGWKAEYDAGKPNYNRLLQAASDSQLEEVGVPLRALMPWLKQAKIGATQAEATFTA
jgi:ketol-acid reductoisomerase